MSGSNRSHAAILNPVPEFTPSFTQPERRSYTVPILLALAVLAAAIAYGVYRFPHAQVEASVTGTAYLPTHTVFKADSIVVGQDPAEDELFVAPSVRLTNHLRFPATIDDVTCTFTDSAGAIMTVSAAQKRDLPNMAASFPALTPMIAHPLLRETTIAPGASADGTLLLPFPFTSEQWAARKSAVVTVTLYHQEPVSFPLPK